MTWTPHLPRGYESAKIWPLVIPYTRGRGLDIGCGPETCLPHMIGVDTEPGAAAIVTDAGDLSAIANESLDFIFSSHFLEHIERDKVPGVLDEWASKLKIGGYLILYLPNSNDYPVVGAAGSNPDHKWNVYPGEMEKILCQSAHPIGWTQFEAQARSQYDEYSLFEVYCKDICQGVVLSPWQRNPDGKKRCLVFRLGAIGDCLVAASPCAALQQEGFYVTMMTSAVGGEILANNPYIDELIVLDKEQFPAGGQIAFMEAMKERYDRVVNLDRSLEGAILAREENYTFEYPAEARRYMVGALNYYELAHEIAGVPTGDYGRVNPPAPGFHPTAEELDWAIGGRNSIDAPLVVWAITGSSFFKVYPWVNVVAGWLVAEGVNVVFIGEGETSRVLEGGIIMTMHEDGADTTKVYPRVGHWTIRQTMAFARESDCVVGPETGVMHALGGTAVPRVIYLSHSSRFNLTANWPNTTALEPDKVRCPCYPCHQIHTVWDTCNRDEVNQVALCAASVAPEALFDAIMKSLP